MKLIYAYVKQYRNIFNQEIAFSDDYHVHLSEGKLHIEKNEDNHAKQFLFGDTVLADLHIPIGQWHTVRALESGTVIMEVKDGPYEPTGEEDILAL